MCEIRYDFEMIFINYALWQILSADIIKCGNKLMEMMHVGHNIMWNLKQSLSIEEKKTIANEFRNKAHTHTRSHVAIARILCTTLVQKLFTFTMSHRQGERVEIRLSRALLKAYWSSVYSTHLFYRVKIHRCDTHLISNLK